MKQVSGDGIVYDNETVKKESRFLGVSDIPAIYF